MTYITTLFTLFYEYFFTGLFSVGGGLATLPFLADMSQRHPEWFSADDLASMIAVSESTPGPIGVNMSTYVGYKVAGIPGSLIAVFALVLPSVIIILIIARALQKYMNNRHVMAAFSGLRPAVTGLIAAAGWLVIKISLFHFLPSTAADLPECFDFGAIILFAAIVFLSLFKPTKKLHPIIFIAAAAVVGIIFKF